MNRKPIDPSWESLLQQAKYEPLPPLPPVVRERIDSTLSALPEQRKRPRRWLPRLTGGVAAAALLGIGVLGTGFVSPDMAAALRRVPLAASVFQLAGDFGLRAADEKGMVTEIGQTVTDQGITLRITEVMYDGVRLSVGYMQESPGNVGEMSGGGIRFHVNGQEYSGPWSGGGSYMDPHTYAGVLTLTPEQELPDQFTFGLTTTRIGDTSGMWSFEFPVRKMASNNRVVMPMAVKSAGELTLTVKRIAFTPGSTELVVEYRAPRNMLQAGQLMQFQMTDDQGVMLEQQGGSGSGERQGEMEISEWRQQFGPARRIPEYVVIHPYVDGPRTSGGQASETRVPLERLPTEEEPLALSQGAAGRLLVTRVERLSDKTLVHYQAEGASPHLQGTSLWIEDEAGQKHLPPGKRTTVVDPYAYKWIREFPAFGPNEKLTLATRQMELPEYEQELEFVIPVGK
ncbi:protein of unknown function [Paenibacillus sp. UNCCL117]|uniref:DUF4179 domain-containing protein n=1 Tax=unclassified Paenibacillus TaxID=185978 RepID=UPI0008917A68|nr:MULTISPECIES: DUF4179 domain-containing protein [unclassified Paenibacillus]SDD86069.1 protein of unknown function [Paenibacillus sp. cl123]SFW54247.1 protein of unknown function [Paenibacillus sp. UNCCL117]